MNREDFLRAIERLESFQHAKPSRRFLVAIDNAIGQIEAFLSRVLDARRFAESDGERADLAHWASEAGALIKALKKERLRIADLLRQGLN